jgi:hypothetical protein
MHLTVIYKLYDGLTACNHYFYLDKLWCVKLHLYQYRLEWRFCSRTIALLDLGNVA